MDIEKIEGDFSVCKVSDFSQVDLAAPFCFAAATDEELSLVCMTDRVPDNVTAREDGWRAFRIGGVLDFSMVGVLAAISAVLAQRSIGIFVVSTYNTDYIFVKRERLDEAVTALAKAGYHVR